ncbi:B-box zinc finger protein 22 [Canna indica]|uniref:B-box zinc finger protein 22 n=1 Tax=Canna indica TaxID=4628 RepID=A0AAQ3KNF7_9LILI|nr:B-box zinc finger protein 22 [Canna indica]
MNKIRCNACQAAQATVLCRADDAALCSVCDAEVHAANKIAGNHQRYGLLLGGGGGGGSSSRLAKCDICQEDSGCLFCLEDRAIFCQKCDAAIHTANAYVFVHQRFLLTGVQVGLDSIGPVGLITTQQLSTSGRAAESPSKERPENIHPMSLLTEADESLCSQVSRNLEVPLAESSMTGKTPDWPLDGLFVFPDLKNNFGVHEPDSS